LNYAWKPLQELLEFLLKESKTETMTRQVLKGIRNMVRMGGSISLRSGVEKILRNLCSCQLPADLNDAKHVYLCKAVMKIIKESNETLGQKNWLHILLFMEKVNQVLNKNKGEMVKKQMELMQFNVLNKKVGEYIEKYSELGLRKVVKEELKVPNNHNLENKVFNSEKVLSKVKQKTNDTEETKLEFVNEKEELKIFIDSLFVLTTSFTVSLILQLGLNTN